MIPKIANTLSKRLGLIGAPYRCSLVVNEDCQHLMMMKWIIMQIAVEVM